MKYPLFSVLSVLSLPLWATFATWLVEVHLPASRQRNTPPSSVGI